MNERISEQARQYADENYPGSFVKYDPEWFTFYNKKFAELIVQECLAISKNREDELESANLIEESNAVGNVSYRISRQFGVKR